MSQDETQGYVLVEARAHMVQIVGTVITWDRVTKSLLDSRIVTAAYQSGIRAILNLPVALMLLPVAPGPDLHRAVSAFGCPCPHVGKSC